MTGLTAEQLYAVITQYDRLSREMLAYNVRSALSDRSIPESEQYYVIADLCSTTRNTTYSWFAPHRDAKIPLKVIARIAVMLEIPLQTLLSVPDPSIDITIRHKARRSSYESSVAVYSRKYPKKSIQQIADDLGIAEGTVRRHMKHLLERDKSKGGRTKGEKYDSK